MDISRWLAYLISRRAGVGFNRRLMKLEIQVDQAAFEEGNTHTHTHKARLACLHSKINGVVEAEIVKEEKGRVAAHLMRALV